MKFILKLYKKIDKKLERAPKRIASMYSNLISGIVGGAILYYLLLLSTFQNIVLGFWYVVFLWFLGLFIVTNVTKHVRSEKSKKEIRIDYLWNTLMSLIGGFYLSSIFVWNINKILASFILIVIFILIGVLRNKK